MGLIAEFAKSPWGQDIPIHAAFYLIWVIAISGFCFLIGHAIWFRYFAKPEEFSDSMSAASGIGAPAHAEKVVRHSLAARLFHWTMAMSMLTLLFTAFLPKVGIQFDWVKIHWIAGLVLTATILFHIFHAIFVMDFWSIWPDKTDIIDAGNRFKRAIGKTAPAPHRFAKYPLENKMYHFAILCSGLAVTCTGIFMIFRVRTNLVPRNPYLFGDMTWGMMYLLHGLAGMGLIGLIMIHIYFALRPEKLVITKSMVFGTLDGEHYANHHDPTRWVVETHK